MTRTCAATGYSPKPCSETPPAFVVVYTSGRTTSSHPACFLHALAEIDRHDASGGIAPVEMVEIPKDQR